MEDLEAAQEYLRRLRRRTLTCSGEDGIAGAGAGGQKKIVNAGGATTPGMSKAGREMMILRWAGSHINVMRMLREAGADGGLKDGGMDGGFQNGGKAGVNGEWRPL